jgi:tetratricopeptide (TPR) repeat protein
VLVFASDRIPESGPLLDNRPRITLFQSANLSVTYVPSGAVDRLVVTFASWDENPERDRPGFAERFLIRRGISAVHVTCAGNDWYQYPEMNDAMQAAARARLSFDHCYTYGVSMGGYAAIRFSPAVGAGTAIAVSPQFSIDPHQPPFDTRWAKEAARIRFIDGAPWAGVRAQVVAIYDSHGIDRRHILLYRRFVRLFEIPVPYSGHNPARFLVNIGLFQDLIAGLLEDHFIISSFRQRLREQRKASGEYFFNLSRAARHVDHALRLSPGRPAYIAARANTLLAMGRPIDAELTLRDGIAVAPRDSWLRHALAIALRRQGRLDAAVQEAEVAIRLAPAEPDHRDLLARLTARPTVPAHST